jgi:hypothetical protein
MSSSSLPFFLRALASSLEEGWREGHRSGEEGGRDRQRGGPELLELVSLFDAMLLSLLVNLRTALNTCKQTGEGYLIVTIRLHLLLLLSLLSLPLSFNISIDDLRVDVTVIVAIAIGLVRMRVDRALRTTFAHFEGVREELTDVRDHKVSTDNLFH